VVSLKNEFPAHILKTWFFDSLRAPPVTWHRGNIRVVGPSGRKGAGIIYFRCERRLEMKANRIAALVLCLMGLMWGCSSGGGGNNGGDDCANYNPVIDPTNFPSNPVVDNQYFPLVPDQTLHYLDTIIEGTTTTYQDNEVTTTSDTKVILGVTCVVVHDVAYEHGTMNVLEDTYDWYAQDNDGNVWYFGEDTTAFEDGQSSKEGSWEAGVDGAKPGIIMWAHPEDHIGATYRQECLSGVAEDKGEVLSVTETKTVTYGTFMNCVQTKDFSDLEPGVVENKFYAPGIGQILAVTVQGGDETEELVDITP
jgi:hypothetical protein